MLRANHQMPLNARAANTIDSAERDCASICPRRKGANRERRELRSKIRAAKGGGLAQVLSPHVTQLSSTAICADTDNAVHVGA